MEKIDNKKIKKLYYSISEIAEIINEKIYILNYWEKNFKISIPNKRKNLNNRYTEKNLNEFKLIKKLIRENNLTLNGAKNIFKQELKNIEAKKDIEVKNIDTINSNKNSNSIVLSKEEFSDLIEVLAIILEYLKNK